MGKPRPAVSLARVPRRGGLGDADRSLIAAFTAARTRAGATTGRGFTGGWVIRDFVA